jgi:hypothetical protein
VARQLVVFASLNQVALLKRALYREGVYAEMVRTARSYSFSGCSFALRCQLDELPMLEEMCRKWKIEPGGIFVDQEEVPGESSIKERTQ